MRKNFSTSPNQWRLHDVIPLLAAVVALGLFWNLGFQFLDDFLLDLGSLTLPKPRYVLFLVLWKFLGLFAAIALTIFIVKRAQTSHGVSRLLALPGRDRYWVLAGTLFIFLASLIIRLFILRQMPLTDDEAAYQFMARLLQNGRLVADSHPHKVFFEHPFMINDGAYYAQYTLGWPALLMPWQWAGLSDFANPVYAALTVYPLYEVVRAWMGRTTARLITVVYCIAPMILIGAATLMAHTSCIFALAWMLYFLVRCGQRRGFARWHAGLAVMTGIAIFVRPQSALPFALVITFFWVRLMFFRQTGDSLRLRRKCVVAWVLCGVLFAAAFLSVNYAQNGSPWVLSYQRVIEYAKSQDFKFSPGAWRYMHDNQADGESATKSVHNYDFSDVGEAVGKLTIALTRIEGAMLGWPLTLPLLLFAGRFPGAAVAYGLTATFLLVHLFVTDSGVDSFGPVHFFEFVLPLILLLAGVCWRFGEGALKKDTKKNDVNRTVPIAFVIASIIVTSCGYAPVRMKALREISKKIEQPFKAIADANLNQAVVFVERDKFMPRHCHWAQISDEMTKIKWWPSVRNNNESAVPMNWPSNFIFWWPLNNTDFSNDILFANHLSIDDDMNLLAYYPERKGYTLTWEEGTCTAKLVQIN